MRRQGFKTSLGYIGNKFVSIISPSTIITDGLVLYLDAGNASSYPGTGTTWTDLSGNGNNSTLTNGPTFNSSNGGSIVFDGTNDYVLSTNNSTLMPSSGITISSWITTNTFDNYATIAMKTGDGSWANNGYGMSRHPTNSKMTFWINNYSNNRVNIDWTTHSDFKNLVGTFDGSNIRLYVNGILINSTFYSSTITTNSQPLSIGSWYNTSGPSTGQFWNGHIARVSIYNRALTAAEIAQNFNANRSRFGI